MELAKLTILAETGQDEFKDEIEVRFNPNQISIQKQVNWNQVATAERDSPDSQFTHGEPATLTVELFFDTYESRTNVREHTNRIFNLAEPRGELHRPPLCRLQWGAFDFNDFQWMLQSLDQRFTLFLDNGMPVRATLNCTFKQWRSADMEARQLNRQSADVAKTRTVRRGDTLSGIAGEEYKDPRLWRPIAQANNIDDPRRLAVGQSLAIPALSGRRAGRRQ